LEIAEEWREYAVDKILEEKEEKRAETKKKGETWRRKKHKTMTEEMPLSRMIEVLLQT